MSNITNHKLKEEDKPKVKRILVVDDSEAVAKSLGMALEMTGYEVKLAYTGPAAVAVARAFRPQVVILDIGLPSMNGYDVCKTLRADESLKNAVFIAQTGWGLEQHRRWSKEAGFHHYLMKPVNLDTLESLLASFTAEE